MRIKVAFAVLLALGLALPVEARRGEDDVCTNADRSTWQALSVVEATARAMGYEVLKSEISGTCYEVYGRKSGVIYELYFNPATAELVKIERE